MKYSIIYTLSIIAILASCQSENSNENLTTVENIEVEAKLEFQNKAHELVYKMSQKIGDYQKLRSKKDVVYTYTYTTPAGLVNVSTEKYMFEDELSYGKYSRHERTLPDFEGEMEQGYDGANFWLKSNGAIVDDSLAMKMVIFSRATNFYWFAMFQKLTDPGLTYEYVKKDSIGDANYDVVKVSFQSNNGKPTDIYQLYINQKTLLVDQFLFTVADFGKMDIPNLMKVEYEEIEGIMIPSKRKYKKSTWNADVDDAPWVTAEWTDITFNNGLTSADFAQ